MKKTIPTLEQTVVLVSEGKLEADSTMADMPIGELALISPDMEAVDTPWALHVGYCTHIFNYDTHLGLAIAAERLKTNIGSTTATPFAGIPKGKGNSKPEKVSKERKSIAEKGKNTTTNPAVTLALAELAEGEVSHTDVLPVASLKYNDVIISQFTINFCFVYLGRVVALTDPMYDSLVSSGLAAKMPATLQESPLFSIEGDLLYTMTAEGVVLFSYQVRGTLPDAEPEEEPVVIDPNAPTDEFGDPL